MTRDSYLCLSPAGESRLVAWEAISCDDNRPSEQVTQLQPSGLETGASAYGYETWVAWGWL